MATTPQKPDPKTLELIYEVVREQLDRQFEQIESLNARAQQLLAFGAGIFGVILALRPPSDDGLITALFVAALVLFGYLVFTGYKAWETTPWYRDPEPGKFWERYGLKDVDDVRLQLVGNWIQNHQQNRKKIKAKLKHLRCAQLLLGIEVGYLVFILILRPHVE